MSQTQADLCLEFCCPNTHEVSRAEANTRKMTTNIVRDAQRNPQKQAIEKKRLQALCLAVFLSVK